MDLRREARARHLLHKDHASHRPLSAEYEEVALIVEQAWEETTGVQRDRRLRPRGDGGNNFWHPLTTGKVVAINVMGSQKPPRYLLVEEGKAAPDTIYVQAHVDFANRRVARWMGWEWGREVTSKVPRYWPGSVCNHCVPIEELRPMADLYSLLKTKRKKELTMVTKTRTVKKATSFTYKREGRTTESLTRLAKESGGIYDNPFINNVSTYKAKEGEGVIRILPPTWANPKDWAYPIYVHYGIGPDKASYLCLNKMKDEPCPICEARRHAVNEDELRDLRVSLRRACWLIDRDNEKSGPLLYSMPGTLHTEITLRSINKKTNEVLWIDDPEEGYDVTFLRTGTKIKTKYTGVEVSRDPSPLTEKASLAKAWLDYVAENPIPDVLKYYDADHIEKVLSGQAESKGGEEDEAEARKPSRRARRVVEEEEEDEAETRPSRKARASGGKRRLTDDEEEEVEEDDEDEEEEEAEEEEAEEEEAEEEEEEDEEEEEAEDAVTAKRQLGRLRRRA
jgi:hypothetical protein